MPSASFILKIDSETIDQVRKSFDVTPESIRRDVQIIKEWMKQEPHLPKNISDEFIERCLLRNKFRVEQTKNRLEKYYTIRGLHSPTFWNVDILLPSKCSDLVFPLPKITPNFERIVVLRMNNNQDMSEIDVMKTFKYTMCASDLVFRNDYCASFRIIHDFSGFTFNHFKKYAAKMTVYGNMYQEAYFGRVTGLEYLNAPPFIDMLMQAGRTLMKPKIFERITIHKDLESLHKNVSREYLPKDYGGTLPSIQEIIELWDEEFIAHRECIEQMTKQISNESLRIGDVKANEIFGVNGTFKTLNLD